MTDRPDVIVVGSGASAVHAACPLVEAGLRVVMLDVGHIDGTYAPLIPPERFSTIRHSDTDQHRYFLGDQLEGIPFGSIRVGSQLTPPRQYISRDVDRLMPLDSDSFVPLRSLAWGGLGAGWGAAATAYGPADMRRWPIRHADLRDHYAIVADRIGICGARDDLEMSLDHTPHNLLPPAELDSNAESIFARYERQRENLHRRRFVMGHARLAVATETFRGRGPVQYLDLDYYGDTDRSVYRPRYTLDEFTGCDNFSYRNGVLVEAFEQGDDGGVSVLVHDLSSGSNQRLTATRLVLAAGAFGSARIALRSMHAYDRPVPIVSTSMTYLSCLNWPMIGRPVRDRRHSLSQLIAHFDPDGTGEHLIQSQFYSYRSLLNFKLVKDSPLACRQSIRIMNLLQPYLVVVCMLHEDCPTASKQLVLQRGDPDRMRVTYRLDEDVLAEQRRQQRQLVGIFRRLGCLLIKTIRPGHGSSIHYGGCLPMSRDDRPLTTTPAGRLRGARGVYVADGATFPDLPCKGITFTLMANANRIGCAVRDDLLAGGQENAP